MGTDRLETVSAENKIFQIFHISAWPNVGLIGLFGWIKTVCNTREKKIKKIRITQRGSGKTKLRQNLMTSIACI